MFATRIFRVVVDSRSEKWQLAHSNDCGQHTVTYRPRFRTDEHDIWWIGFPHARHDLRVCTGNSIRWVRTLTMVASIEPCRSKDLNRCWKDASGQ